jgi:hypothetical protein
MECSGIPREGPGAFRLPKLKGKTLPLICTDDRKIARIEKQKNL